MASKDSKDLPYNEWQATAITKSLKKSGLLDEYEAEIQDYLKRGFLEPVSRSDIADWQRQGGVVCFISHHAVITRDKATTKVCLVSNSSLKI